MLLQYRNTRRAAISGQVDLNRLESGASEEQVAGALGFQLVGGNPQPLYQQGEDPPARLKQGEWRFVREGGTQEWVEVWLKPNIYPSNLLGVTEEGDIICFAWQGSYTEPPGHTLIEDITNPDLYGQLITSAATRLKEIARNHHLQLKSAILLDEGSDVRLEAYNDQATKWERLVGKNREQVRAMLLFSR